VTGQPYKKINVILLKNTHFVSSITLIYIFRCSWDIMKCPYRGIYLDPSYREPVTDTLVRTTPYKKINVILL